MFDHLLLFCKTSFPLAGSIDIIRPLFTVLSSVVNKSQQHWETFLGKPRIKTWLQGEKQVCYLCAMQPATIPYFADNLASFEWISFVLKTDARSNTTKTGSYRFADEKVDRRR